MLTQRTPPSGLAPVRSRIADASHMRLETMFQHNPERAGLETFIANHFQQAYEAQVSHFGRTLLGCRDPRGNWMAALGFTDASAEPLFLEHYLDDPIERAVSLRAGMVVSRHEIAEVGNLAAIHPGSGRLLIAHATRCLHEMGYRWVCFTATLGLLNSFVRLQLQPEVIAQADPSRLPDGGLKWGRYYETSPQVMMGHIASGHAKLAG